MVSWLQQNMFRPFTIIFFVHKSDRLQCNSRFVEPGGWAGTECFHELPYQLRKPVVETRP